MILQKYIILDIILYRKIMPNWNITKEKNDFLLIKRLIIKNNDVEILEYSVY